MLERLDTNMDPYPTVFYYSAMSCTRFSAFGGIPYGLITRPALVNENTQIF